MIAIDPSVPEDVPALCDVCVRAIRAHCDTGVYTPGQLELLIGEKTPEVFTHWMAQPESRFLTGRVDGAIAGVAMVHRSGRLGLLYTAPEAGGRGLGTAMLAAAEAAARAMGLPVLNAKSTLTARTFYESRGYTNLGLDTDGATGTVVLPAYYMAKWLD